MRKNPKSIWWNDEVKLAVEGKVVFGAREGAPKERCKEAYKEEKRKFKGVFFRTKRR